MKEEVLAEFLGVTLTNVRIRQRHDHLLSSAFLEDVDGIGVVYHSQVAWLVMAGLVFCGGVVLQTGLVWAVLLAVLLVIAFFATRKVVLIVHAGRLQIMEVLTGNAIKPAVAFVDSVEVAKYKARTLVVSSLFKGT